MFLAVDVFLGVGFGVIFLKSVQGFRVIEEGKVKGRLLEFQEGVVNRWLFCSSLSLFIPLYFCSSSA